MTYSNLSTSLQQIIIFNYESFGKYFIFLVFFTFLIFYKFIWKPYYQKETPYVSLALSRKFISLFANAYLLFSWLFILMFHPEYAFSDMLYFHMKFFFILMILFVVTLIYDIYTLGLSYVLSKWGANMESDRVKKFVKDMEKSKLW